RVLDDHGDLVVGDDVIARAPGQVLARVGGQVGCRDAPRTCLAGRHVERRRYSFRAAVEIAAVDAAIGTAVRARAGVGALTTNPESDDTEDDESAHGAMLSR